MAKSEPGNAVALKTPAPTPIVPDDLFEMTQTDSGKGVSFNQEDQLIPLIYVLQSNSPVCDKRSEGYVDGAEPGHFWLRNSVNPIADGVLGIEAIPCGMKRTWIEWLPNRQGFVTRHDQPPADMEVRKIKGDDGRERDMLVRRGNGNFIADTREFYLIVGNQPFVLPCTGTKHSFARSWQTMFHQFHHPHTGDVMPSFARKYKLTTIPQSNAQGKWFGLKFQDLGFVTKPEYLAARALNAAMESGDKKAEAPMASMEGHKEDDVPF